MEFKVEENGVLLDVVVSKMGYASKTKARNYIKNGSVMLDGLVVKIPSKEVTAGQTISTGPKVKKKIINEEKLQDEVSILFEDSHIIIADKPCKEFASRPKEGGNKSFTEKVTDLVMLKSGNKQKAYPVNYLNKNVSGYMIFTKKQSDLNVFKAAWKTAYKSYYAVVEGKVEEDMKTCDVYLKENESGRMGIIDKKAKFSRNVVFHYEIIKIYDRPFTALELKPTTVVKDQERAVLKSMGHPVVGDEIYPGNSNRIKRTAMHNWRLKMKHPLTKTMISVEAPLPKRLLDF